MEFCKRTNGDRDGDQSLALFLGHLAEAMKTEFGVVVRREKDVLDLDSSTESKFSRHVVLDAPGIAFRDNLTVGKFVRRAIETMPRPEAIAFRDREGENGCCFVDTAVYTKNRNFRLFLSSKFGKPARLVLARSASKEWTKLTEKEIFVRSLITVTTSRSEDPLRILNFEDSQRTHLSMRIREANSFSSCSSSAEHKSPFPEIDDFVTSLVSGDGGRVRRWLFRQAESALEYDIGGGFRFCGRVGRHHRSNNVRFVVLLSRSVYFQLCHDPDCKEYKSEEKKLPERVQPWLAMLREDGEIVDMPEDDDEDEEAATEALLLKACELY